MSDKPKPTAESVLTDMVQMVESDLMKATHYIEKAISIAILADDLTKANELAAQFVEARDFLLRYQTTHAVLLGKGTKTNE